MQVTHETKENITYLSQHLGVFHSLPTINKKTTTYSH
jgi:hypothetical protein